MKPFTNPKRAILAAALEGNMEPLKQYRNRLEACIYVFNAFSKDPVAYCIYPNMTVEVVSLTFEDVCQMMGPPSGEGFDWEYETYDEIEMQKDLQQNPSKYFIPKGRYFYA